ncbi:MAG: FG-GAP repeat domain-containing protein [Chitinophagaceae bacterium]
MKQRVLLLLVFISFLFIDLSAQSQSWIVKDSILVFPQGYSNWLKRNNGGVDSANPGPGNFSNKFGVGTNQGVDLFDFNKDGLPDLTFQLFPSNDITREYLKGIFLQNSNGKFILDTNFVIKGKGDMWYGGYGDFNGDGLNDYYYITQNYHGADSSRKYSPEMILDNWPDRVFINNGKSFDTLSLDKNNVKVFSAYTADIDNDGLFEIITTSQPEPPSNSYILNIYKYNNSSKSFVKIETGLSETWNKMFNSRQTAIPYLNIDRINDKNQFSVLMLDGTEIGQESMQPYSYKKITLANYNFQAKKINTYTLNRDSLLIPVKYSKQDNDDYYKFSFHEIPTSILIDIDKNGEEELIAGGYYQNNYKINTQRFAYGWKVLGLNGKDLTNQFFKDYGIDRGTELSPLALDIDENSDGIELVPGTWGLQSKFYIDGSPTLGYYYKFVNGKFEKTVITDLKLESGKKLDSTYFKETNVLKYPNFNKNKNALLLYDFNNLKRTAIVYQVSCADVAKPTFDKTTYTVCGTDSTIVKLTNFAKADSTIWYINGSVKTTNIDQLSFKNADTFYVKKIDANGCIKNSDQIIIKKFNLPTAPTISRDTANNLVSSVAFNNTWYKDAKAITDTTQKIKPSGAGSYTVTTTENGCASKISNAYYYLVTDIIKLSTEEFIKLAPNPFQGQLNFDFNVKAYQKLNVEVFELTTGTRRTSQQNVLPGSILSFGYLAPGTYIIKVSSNDQKLSHQFKMIKL